MIKKLLPIALVCIGFYGCYYDVEEELYGAATCNLPATLSYATDIEPIIQSKCATSGCHVSGGGGNGIFDSYQGVKAKVDNGSFEQTTLIQMSMPPSGGLSNCEQQLFEAWIAAGAPQ